jgi:hypothetical protein
VGSKKQTILILNGRRYNALTGELVTDTGQTQAVHPISDVVGARAENPAPVTASVAPTPKPLTPLADHKIMDVSRSTAHTKRRQTQRATTLVRSGLSKPKPGFKSQTKVLAPTQAVGTPLTTVAPKWPVSQVSPTRLHRAEKIAKSLAITKFSNSDITTPATTAPIAQRTTNTAVSAIEHQSQESRDFFERAIEAAESHTQTYVEPKKAARQARKQAKSAAKAARQPAHHHLASVVATSVAVLALCGVIGFQNKTALTLRFADAKAGFHASLPNYQPDGYNVGAFNYSVGTVGTSFHNATTGRDYTLNQQSTNWDSQALLDNYVSKNYPSYQVLQTDQQIVYVFGKNDATWIKNGIWYQLISNGSLSTSQVLNIANSL